MSDALSLLEADCKKLSTRVEKLRAQLEASESELQEKRIAIKVLSEMGISPTVEAKKEAKPSTQEQVRTVLPTSEEEALSPREVHDALNGAITADNVRTILLRLKNHKGTDVRVTDGRYWREADSDDEPTSSASLNDFDELPVHPRRATFPSALETDFESEPPF